MPYSLIGVDRDWNITFIATSSRWSTECNQNV